MPIVTLPDGQELNFPDGTSEDVMRSAIQKNFPEIHTNQDKISEVERSTGMMRTPVDTLRDALAGVVGGLGKGGQTVASALTGGYAPKVDFNEIEKMIASPKQSIGGQLVKGIAEYAPYGAAGGASLLGQAGAGAASGAALTEPGEQNLIGLLPSGKVGGSIESALLNMLTHGAFSVLEKLRPSKMFRGNLSQEQLQKNLEVTKGTETGLGDVIGSPYLKKQLENTLTALPFSGAPESLGRTGQKVVGRGENILSDLLGDVEPDNVPQHLSEILTNEFNAHKTRKNNLYNDVNKLADEVGLKLELPKFSSEANKVADAIEGTNILKFEPDVASIFNKMRNYKNPVKSEQVTGNILDASGKPIIDETKLTYPSLKEANILKGRLKHYANIAEKSPDAAQRNMASVFNKLSSSLKSDIKNTIDESGANELKEAYQKAEKNYAENFSPFLDKEIYKFTSGNADPETIVQKFITTSPSVDLASKLGKLSGKLDKPSRQTLAYAYLSRALDNEGNLNPAKLSTAIKKIGRNQLKTLVPEKEMRTRLLDYTKLEGMNKEAQNLMFNPKTGQRNTDLLMTGLLGALGKLSSGNIAALAAPIATIGVGRQLTKGLTSEGLRNALVKKMIKNKNLFQTLGKTIGSEALMQGLANQDQGNQ